MNGRSERRSFAKAHTLSGLRRSEPELSTPYIEGYFAPGRTTTALSQRAVWWGQLPGRGGLRSRLMPRAAVARASGRPAWGGVRTTSAPRHRHRDILEVIVDAELTKEIPAPAVKLAMRHEGPTVTPAVRLLRAAAGGDRLGAVEQRASCRTALHRDRSRPAGGRAVAGNAERRMELARL
jgi:hypothetical protein